MNEPSSIASSDSFCLREVPGAGDTYYFHVCEHLEKSLVTEYFDSDWLISQAFLAQKHVFVVHLQSPRFCPSSLQKSSSAVCSG